MDAVRLEKVFFIGLLALAIFLSYLILAPYIGALVLAGTLALIFRPAYGYILRVCRYKTLSSLLTVILIVIIVFAPLTFFGVKVVNETSALYSSLSANGGMSVSTAIIAFLNQHFPSLQISPATFNFNDIVQQGLTWFVQNFGSVFTSVAQALFFTFLSLFGLFFLLRDGDKLKPWLLNFIPLSQKYKEEIIQETETVISSVVRGTLMVAVIQGLVMGIGFFVFGISEPAFWGALTVIVSLIPVVGTWLVVVGGVSYLFITGQTAASIGLALWSIVLVNLIYNILSPQLMQRGTGIHPFMILLSVLGGLAFFGPIGFLIGPLVIAFLFSLLHIYPNLILKPSSSRSRKGESE